MELRKTFKREAAIHSAKVTLMHLDYHAYAPEKRELGDDIKLVAKAIEWLALTGYLDSLDVGLVAEAIRQAKKES